MKITKQESDYNQKLRLNSTDDDVSGDIMTRDIMNTARSERLLEARNTANSETMAEMFDSSKKSGKHQNSVKCVSSVCVPAAASPSPCGAHRFLSTHRPPAPSSGQRQVKPPSRGRHR